VSDPISYTRLPGIGNTSNDGRLAYRHRAYMGPDHVLLVRRSRYGETYRRLHLDDIQSVFYAETDDARTFNIAAFVGALSAGGLALVFAQSPIGSGAAGVAVCTFGAILQFVAMLVNLLFGASVRCWIRTVGGETLIPNVGRLRSARRFAQTVEDAVAMRQGVADRELVVAHVSARVTPLAGEGPTTATPPGKRRAPWIFLFAEAGYAGLAMALPSVFPPGIWILFTILAWGVVLMALLQDTRHRLYFPYRAFINGVSFYITARALFWGLYWFLLITEQIIVFEMAQQDILVLGGATIVLNVILGVLGFMIPPSRALAVAPPAFAEKVVTDDSES